MAKDPNSVLIRGRLTADPELRTTQGGYSVVNFTIASSGRVRNTAGQWEDGEATFWNCTAWRIQADNIAKSLAKGMRVMAVVTPEPHSYTNKDGVEVRTIHWLVEEIGASLQYASAAITSNPKTGASAGISAAATSMGSGFAAVGSGFAPAAAAAPAASTVDPWNV